MLVGSVVLKEDDVQFISNQAGDVPADANGFGLYSRDTRFLSRFDLTVNGQKPLFLSSSASKHYIATFQAINPPYVLSTGRHVPQQTVSIWRSRFVTERGLYERVGFLNCNHFGIELDVTLALDVDFQDMFAVRRFKEQPAHDNVEVSNEDDALVFSCLGRDGLLRRTTITFSRPPDDHMDQAVAFHLCLNPQETSSFVVRVQPAIGDEVHAMPADFEAELDRLAASYRSWERASTQFATDNELFDRELLRASRNDIRTLLERTREGVVPDAGIPWYAVPFGRDAIVTALQTLSYNPSIAEGTLRYLAAHQGSEVDPYREEEPGKILHEVRRGELAHLGEIPHTPYFGTVDATPLFLILFVETMRWIGSESLYSDLLPAARRALEWIDRFGDLDGDGYVEYIAHRPGGVVNQGWKDSATAIQYQDGENAVPPIALVEVQGYVYQAKVGVSELLRAHGDEAAATRLEREAAELKRRFNRDFWMDDEQFYALALDRDKRQVRSVTSNAGHCLWSGICDPVKGQAVADRIMASDMFSGWGVRTLSSSSPNYNPMSYHNGSVWPHDTAIISMGMRRMGRPQDAASIVQGMFEAGFRFSGARLPELFCGFARDRRFNSSPTAYAVSCSPQAWAAGSLFMFLQSLLNIEPDRTAGSARVSPVLPEMLGRIALRGMRIGDRYMDLSVEGRGIDVEVALSQREAGPAASVA